MPDFHVRSDSVNVEQIMEQIRARVREKRGVDYTEQQVRELAAVKLEKFLDPQGVRSDLLTQFQQRTPDPNYAFEADTLYETHRAPLRFLRWLLRPLLLLLVNANKLIYVLHMQADVNDRNTRRNGLYYELIHNLVIEVTRLGIEVKNLKMRNEALTSRVEFNERRARALEGAVMYRPAAEERGGVTSRPLPSEPKSSHDAPAVAPAGSGAARPLPVVNAAVPAGPAEGPGQRSRRRRRRRGRRGGAPATAIMGASAPASDPSAPDSGSSESNESAPDVHGPVESDDER